MPIYQFPHSRKLLGLANGFRNGIELEEYEINNPKFLLVTLRSNTNKGRNPKFLLVALRLNTNKGRNSSCW